MSSPSPPSKSLYNRYKEKTKIIALISRKTCNFQIKTLSLQRERRNRVEPRCAERWHGWRRNPKEMMSNSTLPLGFFHSSIELVTCGQLFISFLSDKKDAHSAPLSQTSMPVATNEGRKQPNICIQPQIAVSLHQ